MNRYLKYFKVPFIITAIVLVICVGIKLVANEAPLASEPSNTETLLSNNVFDYAQVLTEEQEFELEGFISSVERKMQCDIAVVILNQSLEGQYNSSAQYWVRGFADGFSDANLMGYEKAGGSNIVFVDNIYREPSTGKVYSWISTYGTAKQEISQSDCEAIMDKALADLTDYSGSEDYYKAYRRVVELLPRYSGVEGSAAEIANSIKPVYIFGAALLVALIYVLINWKSKLGIRTTSSTTYVQGGRPNITRKQDIFLRKTVTKHKRETSSSGGGGGGGGHGGGGHSR